MPRWIKVDAPINQYITAHLEPEAPVLQALQRETSTMEGAQMQISHEQARFMTLLLKAMRAKRTLEVGVYTGYSTLITAAALPADGSVIACDISAEWTAVAQRYWQQAGVADKIDLRLAPAQETMRALLAQGAAASLDFVFIDADNGRISLHQLFATTAIQLHINIVKKTAMAIFFYHHGLPICFKGQ